MTLAAAGAMLVGGAVALVSYARLTKRVPEVLAAGGGAWVGVPLGLLGVAALAAAARERRGAEAGSGTGGAALPEVALPGVLLTGFAATFVPTALSRAVQIGDQVEVGGSYGKEVTEAVPPGALLLTQGDGFLFTMWYEHHVLGRGLDFATLDVGTLHAPWYHRYLRGRYPEACDPLSPEHLGDPAGYRARCGTFAQRMAIGGEKPWFIISRRSGPNRALAPLPAPAEPLDAGEARVVRGSEPGARSAISGARTRMRASAGGIPASGARSPRPASSRPRRVGPQIDRRRGEEDGRRALDHGAPPSASTTRRKVLSSNSGPTRTTTRPPARTSSIEDAPCSGSAPLTCTGTSVGVVTSAWNAAS